MCREQTFRVVKGTALNGAIASAAISSYGIIKDAGQTITGRISSKDLACRSGKHVANGTAMWGGAKLGAMIGTAICPGIGSISHSCTPCLWLKFAFLSYQFKLILLAD